VRRGVGECEREFTACATRESRSKSDGSSDGEEEVILQRATSSRGYGTVGDGQGATVDENAVVLYGEASGGRGDPELNISGVRHCLSVDGEARGDGSIDGRSKGEYPTS